MRKSSRRVPRRARWTRMARRFWRARGAKPFLLKCNEKELGVIAQGATALQRVRAAMDQGISIVLASMGAQGSILADASGAWRAAPLKLNVRSTVGAGDAMLSGFLAAYVRGESVREAFRWAVASASASVEGEGTFIARFGRSGAIFALHSN